MVRPSGVTKERFHRGVPKWPTWGLQHGRSYKGITKGGSQKRGPQMGEPQVGSPEGVTQEVSTMGFHK
jgi:hypothetical protein